VFEGEICIVTCHNSVDKLLLIFPLHGSLGEPSLREDLYSLLPTRLDQKVESTVSCAKEFR
jgi:hypothetical protein